MYMKENLYKAWEGIKEFINFKKKQSKKITSIQVNGKIKAVVEKYSVKKVFLEISQNSQENTCARVSFLTKLKALRLY